MLTLSTLLPTIILTTSRLAGPVPANVSSSLIHDPSDSNVSRAVMSYTRGKRDASVFCRACCRPEKEETDRG